VDQQKIKSSATFRALTMQVVILVVILVAVALLVTLVVALVEKEEQVAQNRRVARDNKPVNKKFGADTMDSSSDRTKKTRAHVTWLTRARAERLRVVASNDTCSKKDSDTPEKTQH
jgi:hypothetical protein